MDAHGGRRAAMSIIDTTVIIGMYLIDNEFRRHAVIEVSIIDPQWIQIGYIVSPDLVGSN